MILLRNPRKKKSRFAKLNTKPYYTNKFFFPTEYSWHYPQQQIRKWSTETEIGVSNWTSYRTHNVYDNEKPLKKRYLDLKFIPGAKVELKLLLVKKGLIMCSHQKVIQLQEEGIYTPPEFINSWLKDVSVTVSQKVTMNDRVRICEIFWKYRQLSIV